jgi:hypothetical protein
VNRPRNKALADQLAQKFGEIVDDLYGVGVHPGDIMFALIVAFTMTAKCKGTCDLSTVKAVTIETMDEIWRGDDVAQSILKREKERNRS